MYVLLDIERRLGFGQYRRTKNPGCLKSRYVYRCLFIFIAVAWVFLGLPVEKPGLVGFVEWAIVTVLATILLNLRFERYQRKAEVGLLPQTPSDVPTINEYQKEDRQDGNGGGKDD